MTRAVAFTEALAMYLKVRKLNTQRYIGMEEWAFYTTVEFHIDTDLKTAKQLKDVLLKYAHSETTAEVRKIAGSETIAITYRWNFDNSIQEY